MITDLFAGPGGWSQGIRTLGLTDIGLEWDTAACKTRAAAGHPTVQCDVAQYPTGPFASRIRGLIASPPCQAWSDAGKQLGLVDQPLVHQAVHDLAHGRDTRTELRAQCRDERSLLAAEPMRWIHDLRPEWIAMEEVPKVLPLWRQYALYLRAWGYTVWTGILNAADYGVPQTRRRAILIASRVRHVTAPDPTHTQHDHGDHLFGEALPQWITMAEALGLNRSGVVNTRGERKTSGGNDFPVDGPSWALTEKARSWTLHTNRDQRPDGSRQTIDPVAQPAPSFTGKSGGQWVLERPATTVCATDRLSPPGHRDRSPKGESQFASPDTVRITVQEASVLQSFPADYPWQGSKTKQFEQIGNAVPPLLAAHIVSAATGIPMPAAQPFAATQPAA
jgi:DNA (cytosine-5)-methyltransferase 1